MPLITFPDLIFPARESIPYSFPIEIREAPHSHGYTEGCPQQATDTSKANGTVSVVTRPQGEAVTDLNGNELTDLPVTAVEDDGTSLEFSIYAGLAAGSYQLQGTIGMPDPLNTDETITWEVLGNFKVKDSKVEED